MSHHWVVLLQPPRRVAAYCRRRHLACPSGPAGLPVRALAAEGCPAEKAFVADGQAIKGVALDPVDAAVGQVANEQQAALDVLQVPLIGIPIVNHDNNQHAENENIRLQNLWDAMATIGGVLATFGET